MLFAQLSSQPRRVTVRTVIDTTTPVILPIFTPCDINMTAKYESNAGTERRFFLNTCNAYSNLAMRPPRDVHFPLPYGRFVGLVSCDLLRPCLPVGLDHARHYEVFHEVGIDDRHGELLVVSQVEKRLKTVVLDL